MDFRPSPAGVKFGDERLETIFGWNPYRKSDGPDNSSAVMAVSIFLEQFMVIAGVLAGASLILLVVRWSNQRDEPLSEIGEIVLRNEAQDSAWMEELRQKHRDANENTIRIWRQYACAVWILLAALIIKLLYVVSDFPHISI